MLFRNLTDCIRFRYVKSSTKWEKLIMFSKDKERRGEEEEKKRVKNELLSIVSL